MPDPRIVGPDSLALSVVAAGADAPFAPSVAAVCVGVNVAAGDTVGVESGVEAVPLSNASLTNGNSSLTARVRRIAAVSSSDRFHATAKSLLRVFR